MSKMIVRKCQDPCAPDHNKVIATGLTFEEAMEHTNDPETSSHSESEISETTRRNGPWFDVSYEEE